MKNVFNFLFSFSCMGVLLLGSLFRWHGTFSKAASALRQPERGVHCLWFDTDLRVTGI
jgi:hypothetical protein